MLHLSLEDIDNNIDQACSEVMEEALTIILTGANPAWLDIDIMSLDQIKVELQRLSLSLHAFIESNDTRNKTNITTSEVINLEIDGEGLCVPVTITATLNKKEPAVKESWSSDSEKKAFEGMQKVLDNMDELVNQYDEECVKVVSDEIMEKVGGSIGAIIKDKMNKLRSDVIYSEEVREQAVNNILERLNAEKKVEEPKLEEALESQKVDPSTLRYHVGSRWEPTVFSVEGADACCSMYEKYDGGEVKEKYVKVKAFVNDETFIEIKSGESPSLSLRQLIKKYQFELLQLEQSFPTLEICRYLDIDPKIRDMFFPLTKDVIDSKIDISMPHPLPSMIDEFIKELHEQQYMLIYKSNLEKISDIEIQSEEPSLLPIHQLIRKYQFEFLEIQQLFPSVKIFHKLSVVKYHKESELEIKDMLFPLTKDVIESKTDVKVPYIRPLMLSELIRELNEQGYLLVYKPNFPWRM